MKKQLSLTIPDPCAENWNSFEPQANGRFCQSCRKTIVDFTQKSDAEIMHFFSHKPAHTCGRFRNDQLKTYSMVAPSVSPGFKLFRAGLLCISLSLLAKPGFAHEVKPQLVWQSERVLAESQPILVNHSETSNEHRVKGIVRDEYNQAMPGINVILKGSQIGAATDADGYFEFPQKLKTGDVLIFSFIGYRSMEYTVPEVAPGILEIDLVMQMDIEVTMGEVATDAVYSKPSGFKSWIQKVKGWF